MHANRGPEHAGEAADFSGITEPRGFLLSDVSGSEKRWLAETCDKPETIKPVSEDQALQDGRHSHAERPAKSRRLDGKDRPERCLLHDSHCSGGQRVPQIPMEGPDVPVQLSSVRVVVSPVGLYQDHTAGCGSPAGDRSTSDHLHRQYPCHGGDRVSPHRPCDSSDVLAGEPGVGDKSPQIKTGPLTGNRIPGVHCQLQNNGDEAPRGENKENQSRGRQSPAARYSVSSDPFPTNREDECGHAGPSDGPPVLQEPPDLPPRGPAGGSELLLNNSVDKGGERRAGVVGGGEITSLSGMVRAKCLTNNRASTVITLFLEMVQQHELPSQIQVDQGGENAFVVQHMLEVHGRRKVSTYQQLCPKPMRHDMHRCVTSMYYPPESISLCTLPFGTDERKFLQQSNSHL